MGVCTSRFSKQGTPGQFEQTPTRAYICWCILYMWVRDLVDGLLGPISGVGIRFQVLSAGFWHGL